MESTDPQPAPESAEVAVQDREPLIVVEGLHKAFGDLEVLRGTDLTINKGESMVVIGGSGTGKSVLIKHLVQGLP